MVITRIFLVGIDTLSYANKIKIDLIIFPFLLHPKIIKMF